MGLVCHLASQAGPATLDYWLPPASTRDLPADFGQPLPMHSKACALLHEALVRGSLPHPPSSCLRPSPHTACQFLWFSGRVSTPLRVEQDAAARTVAFRLAPARCQDDSGCGPGGGPDCSSDVLDADTQPACGHLTAMEGSWTVTPGKRLAAQLLCSAAGWQPCGCRQAVSPTRGHNLLCAKPAMP